MLLVAHHASKTSSIESFLNLVNPKLSIISVGENNFGHPNENVLNRLKEHSIIYRTDVNSSIHFLSDGFNIYKLPQFFSSLFF